MRLEGFFVLLCVLVVCFGAISRHMAVVLRDNPPWAPRAPNKSVRDFASSSQRAQRAPIDMKLGTYTLHNHLQTFMQADCDSVPFCVVGALAPPLVVTRATASGLPKITYNHKHGNECC